MSALLKDGRVEFKIVSGGSEFHAAIELGKNEFWNCSVWHRSGTIARLCAVLFR